MSAPAALSYETDMKFLTTSLVLILLTGMQLQGQTRSRAAKPAAARPVPSARVQPAEGDASRLTPGYTGHDAAAIFMSLRASRGLLRKSQFETTPDYENRIEKIVSSLPGAGQRLTFLMRDIKVSYDADASAFKLTADVESPYPDSAYVAGDWTSPYGRFTSFYLTWKNRTIGSAVGQNAFGVKRHFKVTTYTSLHLAVPSETVSKITRGLLLPAAPSSARVMYAGLRLALTGHLIPPYGAEETSVDTATITEPEEAHYFKYYLYFEPDTAVVYDIRTGEVYGAIDLSEKPEEGRSVLTYSAPTMIEDPLIRQQRMEEARREYPPDHVFKSSEVTRKATLISKPEPGFTEEARAAAVSGTIRVRVLLKYDGTVEVLGALNELPHGLTQKAIEAAQKIRFTPAERNGRKVSQEITIEYNFNVY